MNRLLQLSITSKQLTRLPSALNAYFSNSSAFACQTQIKDVVSDPPEFRTIYKLPTIKYMAIISSLKKYQLIGTAGAIPICGCLEYAQLLETNATLALAYIGITWSICMLVFSRIIKNTIGFIYISPDMSIIKVSMLDFWGNRVDVLIPTNDWVPISELPTGLFRNSFMTTRRYSNKDKMLLFHRNGEITDLKAFQEIIGHV